MPSSDDNASKDHTHLKAKKRNETTKKRKKEKEQPKQTCMCMRYKHLCIKGYTNKGSIDERLWSASNDREHDRLVNDPAVIFGTTKKDNGQRNINNLLKEKKNKNKMKNALTLFRK